MRGKKWFNFPGFDWAKECLTRAGWEVISPADLDREIGFDVKNLPPDTDWNDVSKLGFDLKAAIQRNDLLAAQDPADPKEALFNLLDHFDLTLATEKNCCDETTLLITLFNAILTHANANHFLYFVK